MVQARQAGLIVTEAGKDLVVYDESRHQLHTLNPLAALVWRLADGRTSAPAMLAAAQAGIDPRTTPSMIDLAIADLGTAGLLEGAPAQPTRQSRRTLPRRAVVGGVVLPAVVSITAPMAARAQSTTCHATHFETHAECEAAIPALEDELEARECAITTPLRCEYFSETGCYWIFGSWGGPNCTPP